MMVRDGGAAIAMADAPSIATLEARPVEPDIGSARAPLRFAVLCGTQPLARWQVDCVRGLTDAGDGALAAVVTVATAPHQPARRVLLRWYNALVSARSRALQPADDDFAGSDIPRLPIAAMPAPDKLDFVLAFVPEDELPALAWPDLGVWCFRFGGVGPGVEELPGFRETAHGRATVTVELVAAGTGTVRVLHSATLKTRRTHRKTLDALLEGAVAVCVGTGRRARRGFSGRAAALAPASPPAGPIGVLAGQAIRTIRGAAARMMIRDVWSIGIASVSVEALLAGAAMPMPRWLPPPRPGRFHADPFPLVFNDRLHVLFEMYDASQRRGWIAAAPIDGPGAGGIAAARTALDLGCHMSYPAVVTFDGQTYMAPEISAVGGLRLFRMGDSPWDWTPVAHVLEGVRLVDATLFEHGGRWWLFATLAGPTSDTDLYAWHARSPMGPWTAHALNPIKSDARSARPAGAAFRVSDRLLRPAQDCAEHYGRAIVLNEIVRLDPDSFQEIEVARLEPGTDWPFRDGYHTFNVHRDLIVIDAKRRQVDLLAYARGW